MKPSDIELQRARGIVRDMMQWKLVEMGLRDGTPPDLGEYTLLEMVKSAHMIRDFGEVQNDDGTTSMITKPADRLIAALYTITHFRADEQDDVDPIVMGHGKALVCVVMP